MMGALQSDETALIQGQAVPNIVVYPPGPESQQWLARSCRATAPMGTTPTALGEVQNASPASIVYASAVGSNVVDADGNRFVDLAAGFGAMLLGHSHPAITAAIHRQAENLLQALGDLHPSTTKIALCEELANFIPDAGAQVILGQSGTDALAAALKTATLCTGRPGWFSFRGSYHGLGYGPVALCGLRAGYSAPFREQLNQHIATGPYPSSLDVDESLSTLESALRSGTIGAVVIEPVLGRGGVIPAAPGALAAIHELTQSHGALLVADEVWTGLGRAGHMLYSAVSNCHPDIICLGKGLGGGLPISACIGRADIMSHWQKREEVVHTATFAGAPLACAAALETIRQIRLEKLVDRSRDLGAAWLARLQVALSDAPGVSAVRGAGLMIGIEFGSRPGAANLAMLAMLKRGYLVSTGGGHRQTVVLTPPLTVAEHLLDAFIGEFMDWLGGYSW